MFLLGLDDTAGGTAWNRSLSGTAPPRTSVATLVFVEAIAQLVQATLDAGARGLHRHVKALGDLAREIVDFALRG